MRFLVHFHSECVYVCYQMWHDNGQISRRMEGVKMNILSKMDKDYEILLLAKWLTTEKGIFAASMLLQYNCEFRSANKLFIHNKFLTNWKSLQNFIYIIHIHCQSWKKNNFWVFCLLLTFCLPSFYPCAVFFFQSAIFCPF